MAGRANNDPFVHLLHSVDAILVAQRHLESELAELSNGQRRVLSALSSLQGDLKGMFRRYPAVPEEHQCTEHFVESNAVPSQQDDDRSTKQPASGHEPLSKSRNDSEEDKQRLETPRGTSANAVPKDAVAQATPLQRQGSLESQSLPMTIEASATSDSKASASLYLTLPEGWPATVQLRSEVEANRPPMRRWNTTEWWSELSRTFSFGTMTSEREDQQASRWVLEPSSAKRLCIDLCSTAVLLYDMIVTPYALAWDVPLLEGSLAFGTWGTLIFWTLDIVLCFRTGFYRHGMLEMRPRSIAKHYLQTFFVPDFTIVGCDWASTALHYLSDDMGSTESVKFLRISKLSRLLRVLGVMRIARLPGIFERITTHGGSLDIMNQTVKLLLAILWLNHVISCAWYAIGVNAPSDTHLSWLSDGIGGNDRRTYQEEGFWYQYSTAFHWSMTQMTPGSMQVFPLNSTERFFNICCLVCGLVFFSTMVSSLSAKMMHLKAIRADKTARFQVLCRFLRQCGISSRLAISIQNQVLEQESIQKKLTLSDVPSLANVSSALQMELWFEIARPHLICHPLFRLYSLVDAGAVKKLCFKMVEFMHLLPNSNLFLAGDEARGAYVVMSGRLKYIQTPISSKVTTTTQHLVDQGQWISETALWVVWTHVGTLEAASACELMLLRTGPFLEVLGEHQLFRHISYEYAKSFHARLTSAVPPKVPWPNDLEVPFTAYDEIVCSMNLELRSFIGAVSIELLRHTLWFWDRQNTERLKNEVQSGKCTLLVSGTGEVFRVAAVSVLRITNAEGCILVQVGKWENSRASLKFALPGTKQRMGEIPSEAAKRMMQADLEPIIAGDDVVWGATETMIEWKDSENYSLRTKYIRTVHDVTSEAAHAPVALARVSVAGASSDCELFPCEVSIVRAVNSPDAGLYTWLPAGDFARFQTIAGRSALAHSLASIREDDFVPVMPTFKPAPLQPEAFEQRQTTIGL